MSAPAAVAPVTITLADLRAAWMQRRRSSWPASFEAAMADPMLSRLVRAQAIGRAVAVRHFEAVRAGVAAGRAPASLPTSTSTSPAAWMPARHQAPIFDRKRAASGEREDD